jgi:hypothetical protein
MSEQIQAAIWGSHIRIGDAAGFSTMIVRLPDHIINELVVLESIGEVSGMRYDADLKCAYYLANSGSILSCWTFEHIDTIEKAAELWARIETSDSEVDMSMLAEMYEATTGKKVRLIGTRH